MALETRCVCNFNYDASVPPGGPGFAYYANAISGNFQIGALSAGLSGVTAKIVDSSPLDEFAIAYEPISLPVVSGLDGPKLYLDLAYASSVFGSTALPTALPFDASLLSRILFLDYTDWATRDLVTREHQYLGTFDERCSYPSSPSSLRWRLRIDALDG